MREIKTNNRDRLIELLKQANTLYLDYLENIDQKGLIDTEGRAKFFADHLIANGVIVPPCEIGSDVWYLSGDVKNGWETLKPTHAEKVSGGFNLKMLNSITGKLEPWYFLSKEEAEKALEGYKENTQKEGKV